MFNIWFCTVAKPVLLIIPRTIKVNMVYKNVYNLYTTCLHPNTEYLRGCRSVGRDCLQTDTGPVDCRNAYSFISLIASILKKQTLHCLKSIKSSTRDFFAYTNHSSSIQVHVELLSSVYLQVGMSLILLDLTELSPACWLSSRICWTTEGVVNSELIKIQSFRGCF